MNAPSLDQLHDVIAPSEVAWWPLSLPMWGVVFVLLAIMVFAIHSLLKHWQFRAAKREAISISNSLNKPIELHTVLKRLAKHYYGTTTASKSQSDWLLQLNLFSSINYSKDEIDSLYANTTQIDDKVMIEKLRETIKEFKVKGAEYD